MKEYGEEYDVCPYCGYIKDTPPKNKAHLPGGTMISGRYMLGRVLGYGGFGVTYIAWDSRLNRAVAIKEFFPNSLSTRTIGETRVNCYDDKASQYFKEGVKKMLDEGNRLSKFTSNENIVNVYDCFEENNTAYIVMEYLDGEDLKQYLNEKGGKLPPEEAVEIILPVINALKDMHKEKIIHRDISPDNIFLCSDGKIKLLDFGSARLAVEDSDKSLSIMLKKGFAPKEQYAGRSKQGPWTDVYAVCATLYKMITGELPPESLERDVEPLKSFSEFGIEGYDGLESVIRKGLEPEYTDRIQDVTELKIGLTEALEKKPETISENQEKPVTPKRKKPKVNVKAIIAAAAAVVLVTSVAVAVKFLPRTKPEKSETTSASPSVATNLSLNESEAKIIYEQFLASDDLKSSYPVIKAFVDKDASLCKKEDLESFDMDLLKIKDLSSSTVKEEYFDFDGDGTNEMLLSLDINGNGERVSVYLFDIDNEKKVFNGAVWDSLQPSRAFDHLSVMKDENGKFSFVLFSSDGQNGKDCEKLIYDGEKTVRELSLTIPDYDLIGYASPDFAKCTVADKSLRSEKEYPEENETEYLTYDEACEEWSKIFSGTRITGYCDDSRTGLNSKVELTSSGELNDKISWKLYKSGYLMIEGSGDMPEYDLDNPPWKNNDLIIYAAFSKGITSIDDNMFGGCEMLKSVEIPKSVTIIDDWTFACCSNLTSVTIPDSVTRISDSAFESCTSLASITIPNSVTNIGDNAFRGCTSLTSITIPESVVFIGYGAFDQCTGLTSIIIPDSVKGIGDSVFSECTSLTSIKISESVTSIGEGAFWMCESLTKITIPDSVTSIGEGAFSGCTSLKSIAIPKPA